MSRECFMDQLKRLGWRRVEDMEPVTGGRSKGKPFVDVAHVQPACVYGNNGLTALGTQEGCQGRVSQRHAADEQLSPSRASRRRRYRKVATVVGGAVHYGKLG